ncbi:regulator of microtubule dynamics protein 1-like [Thraustotheca clavata]|uniref:Regulator of microtubule dynamics protein 1 n=1 Tax=Thraustotheca clavata TaxID=74557 RepID=A0A1V9ZIC9_9STRA|nr:regulator of microtubule dynamics protein 1-like [Thraustotheca clavata]
MSAIEQVDSMWNDHNIPRKEVYEHTLQASEADPENPELLWRLCRGSYEYAIEKEVPKELKKKLTYERMDIANKALSLSPESPDCNKWVGICMNEVDEYESVVTKLNDAMKIREYFTKASELSTTDPMASHLLGRWCFRVSDMSWVERAAARAMAGHLAPHATFEEALENFLKSEDMRPGHLKMNTWFIVQTYSKLKKKKEAKEWAAKVVAMPNLLEEDFDIDVKAKAYL